MGMSFAKVPMLPIVPRTLFPHLLQHYRPEINKKIGPLRFVAAKDECAPRLLYSLSLTSLGRYTLVPARCHARVLCDRDLVADARDSANV